MQGKKTYTEKRVEVMMKKLANPDLTTRDIEAQTWVSKSVVASMISKEIGQVSTEPKAKELYDWNLEILKVWAEKLARAMKQMTPEDIRESKDYQSILDVAFKQNQLLTWGRTESIGVSLLTADEEQNLMKLIGR